MRTHTHTHTCTHTHTHIYILGRWSVQRYYLEKWVSLMNWQVQQYHVCVGQQSKLVWKQRVNLEWFMKSRKGEKVGDEGIKITRWERKNDKN